MCLRDSYMPFSAGGGGFLDPEPFAVRWPLA